MKSRFFFNFEIFPPVKFFKMRITCWDQKSKSWEVQNRIGTFFCIFWTHFGLNLKLTNFDQSGPWAHLGPGLQARVPISRGWPFGSKVPPNIPKSYAKKVFWNSETHFWILPVWYFRGMLSSDVFNFTLSNVWNFTVHFYGFCLFQWNIKYLLAKSEVYENMLNFSLRRCYFFLDK